MNLVCADFCCLQGHVADVQCTHKFVPDYGNKLYRSEVGETADLTLSEYYQNQVIGELTST